MYTDALAQEAARARDATLYARIAIDVAAGNKLVYTIPKAAPGKKGGTFGLAAKTQIWSIYQNMRSGGLQQWAAMILSFRDSELHRFQAC